MKITIQEMTPEQKKWMFYLTQMQNLTEEDYEKETDPFFRELMDACRISNLTPEELEEYQKSLEDSKKSELAPFICVKYFPDMETFEKYKKERDKAQEL